MTTPGTVNEDGIPVSFNPISVVHTTEGVTGIPGATAISRWAGATASGPPTSGTFALGDWGPDQAGAFWVCTTAGTVGSGCVFAQVGASLVSAAGLSGKVPVTIPGSLLTTAATLSAFTTAATIASGAIPAGDPAATATYVLRCSGVYSSTGTPTYTFSANYGTTAIAALGAITTGSGVTLQSWEAEFTLQFYSGVLAAGVLKVALGTSTSTDAGSLYVASSGNAGGGNATTGITVVSSTAKSVNLTVACSASSASNAISALTCYAQRVA
jgi:hypothetical protein